MLVDDKRVDTLTHLIKEWILSQEKGGRFTTRQLDGELDIGTPEGKSIRRGVIKELCDRGIIERIKGLVGTYRILDIEAPEIDWQSADPKNIIKLKFPFELEKYVKVYPKSIICVAGGKDQGKTLWLYDFVLKNMYHPLGIDLYNSETGREQMKERMDAFKIDIPNPSPFRTFERYDNFADVINPDRISVIDYLDLNSEVYQVGDEIDKIFRKLKGVAVIGLQKPPPTVTFVKGVKKLVYRDLAYGGGFSAKRAVLYISLDNRILKLVIAKTPASRNLNPTNMMWGFQMRDGAEFYDVDRYYEREEY